MEHANRLALAVVEQFLPGAIAALSARDAVLSALPAGERDERYRAEVLLAELGLGDTRRRTPRQPTFRAGSRIDSCLRAMIGEPDLLLLDEPTNHLDLGTLHVFERFLLARPRLAWLLISHDRRFLDQVTKRTLFLRDGRIASFDLPSVMLEERWRNEIRSMPTTRQTRNARFAA